MRDILAIAQGASAGIGIVGSVDTIHSTSQMLVDPVAVDSDEYIENKTKSRMVNAMIGFDATAMGNSQLGMPETVDATLWDTNLTQVIQEDGSLKQVQNDLPGYTQVKRMSGY